MNDLSTLLRDCLDEGKLSRRGLLAYGTLLSSLPLLNRATAMPAPSFAADPFSLGVASGDPDEKGFVLWTRLAPNPLVPGGGMPQQATKVSWQVASDDSMRNIVASGTTVATPQLGYSVHVEVDSLAADRWYWYRFQAGDAQSPIGRARTMPQADTLPDRLRFAFASCQNYEQGYYTAYQQMAQDDVDLVFHLGDYIYEYEAGRNGKVRTHLGAEIQSLDDYRIRHSQYRSDRDLQAMHAVCPWLLTWDDHEFDNNCANDISEERGIDPVDFLIRRANAYQAYYEMMPLRASSLPRGCDMQLYRKASFGQLAEFLVLDTRQYRTDQPNGDRKSAINESASVKSQTMLGREQRNWMYQNLLTSPAIWNVLAQQVMMGMVNRSGNVEAPAYSMDQWPGYTNERMEILRFMQTRQVNNPIVLTGDIHSNWVNELRMDDRQVDTPLIATEFVATSISSGGNGPNEPPGLANLLSANPCVKFHNAERGYVRCEVTPASWKSDYMVVDDVLSPGGNVFARRSFVVEAGDPSVKPT